MSWAPDPLTDDEAAALAQLGPELLAARTERGISQRDLALAAEVNAATVSRYERGLRRVRRSTLERIARALVDEDLVAETVDGWVALAGPGVAPETQYAARVDRRRQRRTRKQHEQIVATMRRTAAEARNGALRYPTGPNAERMAEAALQMAVNAEKYAAEHGLPVRPIPDRVDLAVAQAMALERRVSSKPSVHPADRPQPWQVSKAHTPREELAVMEREWQAQAGTFADQPEIRDQVEAYLDRLRHFVRTGADRGS